MKSTRLSLAVRGILFGALVTSAAACGDTPEGYAPPVLNPQRNPVMTFFVTSKKNMTGDLGGLAGADRTCQELAEAAGGVGKTWRAYLSAEKGGPDGGPVHARDRIGAGPWRNYNGLLVASSVADLHSKMGSENIFRDERAIRINGQWAGSDMPVEHDILTGSQADGTVYVGRTCLDWTSAAPELKAQVGHSDGLGPMMMTSGTYTSWNSAHENAGCNDTTPLGGAGRFYCFALN
jgi:hypothetical protein